MTLKRLVALGQLIHFFFIELYIRFLRPVSMNLGLFNSFIILILKLNSLQNTLKSTQNLYYEQNKHP